MSNDNMRAAVRRLLKRWGAATQMCRRKQEEIAEYSGLIDATYGLHAQQYSGMPHGGEVSNPTAITAERAEKLRDAYRRRIADITDDIANLMDFCAAMSTSTKLSICDTGDSTRRKSRHGCALRGWQACRRITQDCWSEKRWTRCRKKLI